MGSSHCSFKEWFVGSPCCLFIWFGVGQLTCKYQGTISVTEFGKPDSPLFAKHAPSQWLKARSLHIKFTLLICPRTCLHLCCQLVNLKEACGSTWWTWWLMVNGGFVGSCFKINVVQSGMSKLIIWASQKEQIIDSLTYCCMMVWLYDMCLTPMSGVASSSSSSSVPWMYRTRTRGAHIPHDTVMLRQHKNGQGIVILPSVVLVLSFSMWTVCFVVFFPDPISNLHFADDVISGQSLKPL